MVVMDLLGNATSCQVVAVSTGRAGQVVDLLEHFHALKVGTRTVAAIAG